MAKLNVNIGLSVNDKTGDTLRSAFDKINQNFTELYNTAAVDLQLPAQSTHAGKFLRTDGTALSWVAITNNTTNELVNGTKTVSLGSDGVVTFPGGVFTISNYQASTQIETWTVGATNISPTNSISFFGHSSKLFDTTWTISGSGITGQSTITAINPIMSGMSIIGYTVIIAQTISAGLVTGDYVFSNPPITQGVNLSSDLSTWTFGNDGTLTVPGPIFRDGGLYMNSGGSTTAASVFVSGNSGGVILRTADNANNVSHDLIFDVNGDLTVPGNVSYPGGIKQSQQDNTQCLPNVDTVVYTATDTNQHAIKLFVMVEGLTDGGGVNWDTQACDVIAVKGFNNNIVHVTTYGVTYSGATAIAEFDGQWNVTTNRIEITCRPTSVTNDVRVSVHAIEMTTND